MVGQYSEIITQALQDPTSIISILGIYATIFTSSRIGQYFQFKRAQSDHNKIVILPPSLLSKIDDFDDSRVEEAFKNEIIDFYKKLSEHFSDEVLANFTHNIKDAKIKRESFLRILQKYGGYYSPAFNTIKISALSPKSTLTHELLHLASCKIDKKNEVCYSGFLQFRIDENGKEQEIGRGLNEGYTEVINRRYFHPESKTAKIYEYMYKISRCLEKIIGRSLMEESYFKGDLLSVTNKLSEYLNYNELQYFLDKLEFLFQLFIKDNGNTITDHNSIQKSFEEVNNLLIKAYINKLVSENKYSEAYLRGFIKHLPSEFIKLDNVYFFGINPDKFIKEHRNEINSMNQVTDNKTL